MVLQTRLAKKGGAVKLSAIRGTVADVLNVVRLNKVLGIYGDIEFARQAFKEEALKQAE
jgi:anti-anti-sigma regulatory factor